MSDKIDPANMTFDDLYLFQSALAALFSAGQHVSDFDPRFCVIPGRKLTMTLDYAVPAPQPAWPYPPAPVIDDDLSELPAAITQTPDPAPLPAGTFIDRAPEPAAPVAGSASALAAVGGVMPWTEAEDDLAIRTYCAAISKGLTLREAAEKTALAVSRPLAGTAFRMRNKLADRVKARLAPKSEIPAPPKPEQAQGLDLAEDKSSGGQADRSSAAPSAAPLDALTAHLSSLPRKDSWSLEADLELARLSVESGWGLQDIAVEFGMDAGEVKARWDALTGLHRDKTTDKLQRAFSGPAVFEALKAMAAA